MTKNLQLYCAGCVVLNSYPKDCGNCPNLKLDFNKYNSLLKNYYFIMAYRNSKGKNGTTDTNRH